MPNLTPFLSKNFKYDRKIRKHNNLDAKDPDYFKPYGISVFYGAEGSGKTIALMHVYNKLKKRYPLAVTVSNLNLLQQDAVDLSDTDTYVANRVDRYYSFISKEDLITSMQTIRNGKKGVIQLNDEYQNYFSNQDSKNVPPALIEQNAQNRKQRRLMLSTSQDYDQLAKAIRRRADLAIKCKTYSLPFVGDCLTVFWVFDAKSIDFENNGRQIGSKPLKIGWFFHTVELRESYDTNQIIFTGDTSEGIFKSPQQSLSLKTPEKPRSSLSRFKRR